MRYLLFILLAVILSSCAAEKNSSSEEIRFYGKLLSERLEANKEMLNRCHFKSYRNRFAEIYLRKVAAFNAQVVKLVDTTFQNYTSDTSSFHKSLKALDDSFHTCFQDLYKLAPHTPFMRADSVVISKTHYPLLWSKNNTPEVNYFLSIDNVLSEQEKFLKLFEFSFGSSADFFTNVLNAGYCANVYETETSTKIKLYYSFPRSYATHTLVKFSSLKKDDEPIQLISKVLQNDTVYLETKKLAKGNYKALVNYSVKHEDGREMERDLTFRFSVW